MSLEPSDTASELRRVLALAAGAVVYVILMTAVALLADQLFASRTIESGSVATVPSVWIGAWGFGGLIASTIAIEATKRIAPGFNRVGLAVILVLLGAVFAVVVFLGLSDFGSEAGMVQAFGPVLSLIGTIVGLARELPALRKKSG